MTTTDTTGIRLTNLHKEFGDVTAVNGVDLTVHDGEFLVLVGPSGCGKSTTLRLLAGLESATSGTVTIHDSDVTDAEPGERDVAMVFQSYALYPHMTARRNMSFALEDQGMSAPDIEQKVSETAEMLGITEQLNQKPGELSGGQQQRVALGRSIVRDPDVFLLDEPLSNLDAKLRVQMRAELQKIHNQLNRTMIYVTHDQEEAMTMSDRIAIMNDGRIEQIDTPDRVYEYPDNTFVARFIGNPTINFFEGTLTSLTESEGRVDIHGETLAFTVDYLADQGSVGNSPEEVTVGIRPTDIELYEEGRSSIQADIQLLERLDNRVLTTLEHEGEELRAFVPTGTDSQEGDTVSLSFNVDNLHIFDASSDELLVKTGT